MPDLIRIVVHHPVTNIYMVAIENKSGFVLKGIFFNDEKTKDVPVANEPRLLKIGSLIYDFLDKKLKDLSMIPIDLKEFTPFQRDVLETARKIRWGEVISYKELARRSGYPNAVRAAASVMRNNRYPIVIPCHRVIRSDGGVGGFSGKLEGAEVELKRRLLEREDDKGNLLI
jgi:O-6-methylguanine DNA methyltransferase